jgi:HPt (histidine-containing phosphotransfer) domain-containing protein
MTAREEHSAPAALARLRRFGGERLVRDMAAIFIADMPERLALARSALAAENGDRVAYAAHTMKSSAAQFGAGALERLCAAAERAARANDLAALPALVAGMERELAAFRSWLDLALAAPATAPSAPSASPSPVPATPSTPPAQERGA